MRPLAHAVIVAAFLGSAPTSGHAAEPPATTPPPPPTALPVPRSPWQLSKHIGQPAPSPADLGLTWLKGDPVKEWSKDRPTVLAYQPPIRDLLACGWSTPTELWLRQLVRLTGRKADVLEVSRSDGLPFALSVDAPIVNWPIARADWAVAGPRLTDDDHEWYPHVMVIDTRGHVAWVGTLRTTGAAYAIDRVSTGSFDASVHMALLRKADELDDQLGKARSAGDEAAVEQILNELTASCPWRRSQVGQERVRSLVQLNHLEEAAALSEILIHSDCQHDFDSLKALDGRMFDAGVLTVRDGRDAARFKALRASAMAAAADALDQADAWTDAEAAERFADISNWSEAVRWQSLALSYASESQRDDYQKKLQSYIDRLEGRTPPEDINPMFHK